MRHCTPLVVVLLAAPWLFAAEDADDRVLKLFADEFVHLTPGKGKFPAMVTLGSGADTVTVRFKSPFAIAKYEVTQELWQLVTEKNASRWKGKRNSAEMMTWDDATAFCEKATTLLRKKKLLDAKQVIRLPSEAEWEYACRAGTTTKYSFGDEVADLRDFAWFIGNSKGEDPPVGKKKPNPWGLYDMHGYVWEWCADAWADDVRGTPTDGSPRLDKEAKARVIRGGSWADPAEQAASGYRGKAARTDKNDRIGFRCVRSEGDGK